MRATRQRPLRELARIVGLAAVALVSGAGAVAAHVSVEPTEAKQGATAELVFVSPNERSTAVVGFEVALPDGLTTVVPSAPPGWSVSLSGQVIRWSGGRIAAGASTSFPVRLGPLPSTDSVIFPALQTYEDGVGVRWDQPLGSSGQRPAPAVFLTAAAPEASGSSSTSAGTAGTTGTVDHVDHDTTVETAFGAGPVVTAATKKTDSVTGAVGIVLAVLGVAFLLGWGVYAARQAQIRRHEEASS
jgi:uncharacterized protein YcnI